MIYTVQVRYNSEIQADTMGSACSTDGVNIEDKKYKRNFGGEPS